MNTLKLEMKIDDLGIPPTPAKEGEKPKEPSVAELIGNVIRNIVLSYSQGQRGLNGAERTQYYRLTKVLDKAVEDNATTVDIEDEDAGFLKKCRREAKMMPNEALQRVEELIDGMVRHK